MRSLLGLLLFLPALVGQRHGDCPERCPVCPAATRRLLRYVTARQLPGGGWGKDEPVPVYSLVHGLSLLATGSTPKKGPYRSDLARFVGWLLRAVPPDGDWGRGGRMETWQTAFAVLVFAALEDGDPRPAFRTRLAGLRRRLESLQLPTGGWFHGPEPMPHYSRDLVAATNLALLALHAARRVGVAPAPAVVARALAYYPPRQNRDGGFPYGTAPHMEELARSAGGRTLLAWYVLTLWGRGGKETARRARAYVEAHWEDNLLGDRVHGVFPQYFWLSTVAARHLGPAAWRRYVETYLRPLVRLQALHPQGRIQPLWRYRNPPRELERFRRYAFSGGFDTAAGALALLASRGHLRVVEPAGDGELRERALAALLRLRDPETGAWTARFGGEPADLFVTSLVGLGLLSGGGKKELLDAVAAYVARTAAEYRAHWTFQHPLALLFLVELTARTPDPRRARLVRRLLEAAARYQNPDGGWTYGDPRKLPFGSNMASTYCVLLALARARAAGFTVPAAAYRRGFAYLRRFQNPDGGFRYHRDTQFVSTAGALAALLVAGETGPAVTRAATAFRRGMAPFLAGASAGTLKGHFLTSFALVFGTVAAHRLGGATAAQWDRGVAARLAKEERPAGGWSFAAEVRRGREPLALALGTAAAFFALSAPGEGIGLLRSEGGKTPVPPPARRERALRLGRLFRGGADRTAFLAALEAAGLRGNAWIEIGWTVPGEGRELFVLLSRTPARIAAMTDAAFAAWQDGWNLWADRDDRRWHPLPGELRGYGTAAGRRRWLGHTDALRRAATKADFLRRFPREAAQARLLYPARSGTLTLYRLPLEEIRALDEAAFRRWRRRFLTWVEIHVPGPSRVRHLADLSEEAFRLELAAQRHRYARLRVRRLLGRFARETGLLLRRPDFVAERTAPVLRAVVPDSPAAAAGFHPGERILRVEDRETPEWMDVLYAVRTFRPGSTLRIQVAVGARRAYRYLTLPAP